MGFLKRAADRLLPFIDKCVICGIEKGVDNFLCGRCREKLYEHKGGQSDIKGLKAYCAFDYYGYARKIVRGFKYSDKRYLASFMAQEMAKAIAREYDFITYVPLHKKRRKCRGFDQAELLAKALSKQTDIPFIKALERKRNTPTQTKLNAKEREENMAGAFESVCEVGGKTLLVDDVLTTGATAYECARVLKKAGSDSVFVLTFARSAGDTVSK